MQQARVPECSVCGCSRKSSNGWFLIAESRWQDKVKILRWHEQLAQQPGIHHACSPAHAQELVVHWMITGSLDYPFARTQAGRGPRGRSRLLTAPAEIDTRMGQQIGELAIHRESIHRILRDSPLSLSAVLDALLGALQKDQPRVEVLAEDELAELCGVEVV